jgi:hypothetical protein
MPPPKAWTPFDVPPVLMIDNALQDISELPVIVWLALSINVLPMTLLLKTRGKLEKPLEYGPICNDIQPP